MIKKIKNAFYTMSATALVLPVLVSAKGAGDFGGGSNQGAGGSSDLAAIIQSIIKFFLGFIGGLSVLIIVIAGIMYITSGGDEGRVDSAKRWLTYSIVGLIVALLGWVIVDTVIKGLG
ncbi:MAG: TrbC/VirB2 family protein [Candidatus Moraniibacteriota bacterium]|jgi:type IV secretory pathway VirB2 component (pilin)